MKLKLLFLMILGAFVVGCNGAQTNPMQGNQAFNNLVPYHGQKVAHDEEPSSPFVIDVNGDNELNYPDFVEGQQGSIAFRVRVLLSQIQDYTLVPVNLPGGAQILRSNDDPNVWLLTWTPPMGIIPQGRSSYSLPIEVQANVTKYTDLRLREFVSRKTIDITVNKSPDLPTIVGVTGFKDSINQEGRFEFTVEVKDPSSGNNPPVLNSVAYAQGPSFENFKGDGASFVAADSQHAVDHLSNGDWLYHLTFDTSGSHLPYPLTYSDKKQTGAQQVAECFGLQAVSPYGNESAETPLCLNVKYPTPPAAPAAAPVAPKLTTAKPVVTKAANKAPVATKSESTKSNGSTAVTPKTAVPSSSDSAQKSKSNGGSS